MRYLHCQGQGWNNPPCWSSPRSQGPLLLGLFSCPWPGEASAQLLHWEPHAWSQKPRHQPKTKIKREEKNTLICYTWEVFMCHRTEGHQKVAEGAIMCRLDFCVSIYPAMHPSFPFLCCLWDTDRNMRSADVLTGFWLVEWRVYFYVYCTPAYQKLSQP